MIVLLNYSTSWSKNDSDTIPSTGELTINTDSVLIAVDDLRKANAKMVELKYEKETNKALREIVENDDRIIREYNNKTNTLEKQITQVKKQRNYAAGGGLVVTILLVIAIIF